MRFRFHYPLRTLFAALILAATALARPVVGMFPEGLEFGTQALGTSVDHRAVSPIDVADADRKMSSFHGAGVDRRDVLSLIGDCNGSRLLEDGCLIDLKFRPQETGFGTDLGQVAEGASGAAQKMQLSGPSVVPLVGFTPPNITFSTQVVGVSSQGQPLTLQNVGTATLDIFSIAATGDFSQTNNCGDSVAAGANCTITVTFTPQAVWTRTGTIIVSDNAGSGTQTVILSGMGSSGGVPSLSITKLAFGSEVLGQSSSPQNVTLTNTGSGAIAINTISASGDFSQTNNCGGILDAGNNCSISATFTPSWAGSRTGEIVLNMSDPPSIEAVNLSGTGTSPNTPVSIAPQVASLTPTQTVQFQAAINGQATTDVTWSVDGIVGGNGSVGMISSGGLYTPPGTAGSHTITATNNQNTQQSASVPLFVTAYAGTFTQHNDNARTGQNLNEIALSPATVNQTQFGKLFSQPVDGFVYAQPLYAAGVNIPGQGVHNVVYVATEHDSVYAFDADSNAPALWKDSFINPPNVTTVPSTDYAGHYTDIVPEIGITGTPVIDPATNALYVVAKTKELVSGKYIYVQRLHALDITTGAELSGSPVVIKGSVKGHGLGNDGHGNVPFDPFLENQRPGLLLVYGVVYVSFGSHGDQDPFHGWVIGYHKGTLKQVAVRNTTPNSGSGGIWQGGGAPAADTEGNIFAQTSNGGFDGSVGGFDYGDSFLRMSATSLRTLGYFTPFDQQYLRTHNLDVGSGGPLILPDQPGAFPHLLVGSGKTGRVYLVNRDAMGGYSPAEDSVVQEIVSAFSTSQNEWGIRGLPAYWQNQVYFAAVGDVVKVFPLSNGLLSAFPLAKSMSASSYPGATPVISANAQTSGILWLVETDHYAKAGPAYLRAYDATNVGYELYNSNMNPTRDMAGPAVKFAVPSVANGKVYVGTQTELDVYGLLP